MESRNHKYIDAQGRIDCEINHPEHGWIPFTASPNDAEESGRTFYQDLVASGINIAPYVPSSQQEVFEAAMAAKIVELYTNVKKFIEFQPNGFIRYDADLKLNIMGAMMQAQAAGQSIPALCAAFQTWITAVQMEFLTLKAQIDGGNLDVDVSYEMFEGKYGREGLVLPDPHVTTAALLGQ